MSLDLLKKLCETPGVPGREERVREIVADELKGLCDEVSIDPRGNVIGLKRGCGPAEGRKKVMISGHMDEIGFLVKYIDDRGFVRILANGYFDPRNLVAQRVVVHGRQDLRGVLMPAIKPIHILPKEEANKIPEIDEFFIDLGLTKEAAEKLIRIGDFVTLDRDFIEAGDQVTTKALDDRVGVYVMIEALRRVKNHNVDIYAVGSVQEETQFGVVGSAYAIAPDIGVAVDITLAHDVPGAQKENYITALGEGAAIKIIDSASVSNYKLVDFLREVAEKNGIKHQMELLPRGGTDAGPMASVRAGAPVVTISIPTRYGHTVVETANKADIEACIELLARFLEVADKGDFRL